jgi:hypothetical protein
LRIWGLPFNRSATKPYNIEFCLKNYLSFQIIGLSPSLTVLLSPFAKSVSTSFPIKKLTITKSGLYSYTTAGVKIFWEQARIVLWMIRPEKLTSIKWLTLKKHLKQLVAERRLLSRIEFLKKVLMGRTSRASICETQSIRKAGDHSDRREDSELSICQILKELGIHLKH